jgi:hypothetical protein
MALDAQVEITGKSGVRTIPVAELHKPPGNSPQIETTLAPGELISAFTVSGLWPRSLYLKVRDRASYEFALSAAAIALNMQDGVISDARVALGGVATIPWRSVPPKRRSPTPKLKSTMLSRLNWESVSSHGRCIKPRPWRFEHVDCSARTQGKYGPTDSALRRRSQGDR